MTDILAIGAHPDDIEFGCGGILAREAKRGKSIVFVDLTRGEMGSNGTPEIREQEAMEAAAVIGAERTMLGLPDCGINDGHLAEVMAVIRHYRPRVILAPYFEGQGTHPDHIACGLLVRKAARYVRLKKMGDPHIVQNVLHYPARHFFLPDFLFDISNVVETWKEMISCHKSQMETKNYLDLCLRQSAGWGIHINAAYAQCLIKGNPAVIDSLDAISKGTIEF